MKESLKKNTIKYGIIALIGVLIGVSAVYVHQAFFRILPLFISLIISYLQSKANRYAPLLGGINALLYAAVYGYYHLYASMVYAILISCPIQILTFLRWRKNSWGTTTLFRGMTWKQRALTAGGFVLIWCIVFAVLGMVGSDYAFLDNTITLFGILISFLTMFAYIEYAFLMVPHSFISIILYAVMLQKTPEQFPYLLYSVYCFVCQCIAFVNVRKAYKIQTGEKNKKESFINRKESPI